MLTTIRAKDQRNLTDGDKVHLRDLNGELKFDRLKVDGAILRFPDYGHVSLSTVNRDSLVVHFGWAGDLPEAREG